MMISDFLCILFCRFHKFRRIKSSASLRSSTPNNCKFFVTVHVSVILLIQTEHTKYFAKNLKTFMYKDWLHCIIFRLETIVSFFFMESLNCSTVIDQRNNNISILCEAVNLKSTSSVHSHLEALEKNGYIRRDATKPRAIEIIDDNFIWSAERL